MHHSPEGLLSVHAAVLIFSFTALPHTLFANGLLHSKQRPPALSPV
ncbi:MAG: hypothetical protein KJO03_03975 [Gammaproteobacteria bacterium]|nr:hypothetical protein [Gammaproteobacteria bacterium]